MGTGGFERGTSRPKVLGFTTTPVRSKLFLFMEISSAEKIELKFTNRTLFVNLNLHLQMSGSGPEGPHQER